MFFVELAKSSMCNHSIVMSRVPEGGSLTVRTVAVFRARREASMLAAR